MSGNDWQTPDSILDLVRQHGDIEHDPATTDANPVGARTYTTAADEPCGLFSDWPTDGLVYCNPPFGRGHMDPWAAKIIAEAERGCEIIALTRGDMSTAWSRRMALAARLICFPPRIRFRDATGSPPFSNTLFYFGPRPQTFRRAFADLGPICAPIRKERHAQ